MEGGEELRAARLAVRRAKISAMEVRALFKEAAEEAGILTEPTQRPARNLEVTPTRKTEVEAGYVTFGYGPEEHFPSVSIGAAMEKRTFDQPVRLLTPTRRWTVASVPDAADCLRSPDWSSRASAARALDALRAAEAGLLTRAEAREAFEEAALEAHLLDIGPRH